MDLLRVELGLLFIVQVVGEMVPKKSYQKRGINIVDTRCVWLCC